MSEEKEIKQAYKVLAEIDKVLADTKKTRKQAALVLYFYYFAVTIAVLSLLVSFIKDINNPPTKMLIVILAGGAVFYVIVNFIEKNKIKKIFRECGFILEEDSQVKYKLVRELRGLAVFSENQLGIGRNIGETLSLNIPNQKAYAAAVHYGWGSGRYARGMKTGQAFIWEAKGNLSYIKIAPKTGLFTRLKFFYKPAKENLEEIKIDKGYNLYSTPERAQAVLDILSGILPQIKKDKFVVEMYGKWIVVIKWGYTTNFDKFVNKAMPIAKVFDEKRF